MCARKYRAALLSGLALLGLLVGIVACGYAGVKEEQAMAPSGDFYYEDEYVAEKEAGMPELSYAEGADIRTSFDADQVQERLIIRNADLAIVVDDTEEIIDAVEALVNGLEGWVVNSNVWEYNSVKRGSISVRIPAESLDAFLDDVHALANEVTNESVSGLDVTEDYVDVQAQLANLQATADRVRAFLDRADDVEEALAVNVELSRLEGEIERLTGRKQYLERSARYSSVTIEITPDELAQPMTIGRWQPEGTARDAIEALLSALRWLVDLLIFLVILVLPLLFIIIAPIYLLVRFLRRRRARRRAAQE